jgi:hypothetical protein
MFSFDDGEAQLPVQASAGCTSEASMEERLKDRSAWIAKYNSRAGASGTEVEEVVVESPQQAAEVVMAEVEEVVVSSPQQAAEHVADAEAEAEAEATVRALCGGTQFGMTATAAQRTAVTAALAVLQGVGHVDLQGASVLPLEGEWQLLYCSAQEFRSSPFFWVLQVRPGVSDTEWSSAHR